MAKLSPIGNSQVVDSAGDPASGWKWYTYVAGSSEPQATYTSEDSSTAHANPVVLDSSGRPSSPIWLTEGASYKLVLTNSLDVVQATFDNIDGINDASVTIDQWAASGFTPTYVSGTSFTVVGDQTTDLQVNRRVKIVDAGGTKYGYIATSVFTTLTTVTVTLDSGTLASPLSSLSLGIQTSDNPSEPLLTDAYPVRSGSSDKTKKVKLEVDGLTTSTTRTLTVQDKDGTIALTTTDAFTTGDVKLTIKTAADSGWVLMNDGTIGNASSGGTTRANADTEALFTLLWTNTADAQCAVSTGRGASAAADFAANKTIALPKSLGRALAVYGAGSGLTSRALALITGTETHTLTSSEVPANQVGATQEGTGAFVDRGTASHTGSASAAHPNMQPTVFLNVMIKL